MFDGYGTPCSSSSSLVTNKNIDFSIDEEEEEKASLDSQQIEQCTAAIPQINRRPTVTPKKPKVVRIWHPDNLAAGVEHKDLDTITSFKSALITPATTTRNSRDFVAGKLLIQESNQFGIYAIKEQDKKKLGEDILLLELLEDEPDLKLAFLALEGADKCILGASLFEVGSGWDVRENAPVTHRKLLNYVMFEPFSDVSFVLDGTRVASFRCILEARCPQILEFADIVKKRKEKKTSTGTFLTIRVKENCVLTLSVLLQLLDYIYSDNLDFPKLEIKEILYVQRAATALGIKRLIWQCSHYLYSTLGIHNVHQMLREANDIEVDPVKEFCISFAQKKWGEFSAHKVGLETLGLDLFQELAILIQTRSKDVDTSYSEKDIPASSLLQDLRVLHERMEYTDAIALFGEVSVPFHRCLFAAHEPKLAQMFLDKKDHKPFKNFPISVDAFRSLQEFIYCGSCTLKPPCACVVIEEMVQKYELERFRCLCEEVVNNEINTEIVLRSLALTYLNWNSNRDRLTTETRQACLEFIVDHFSEINIHSIRHITPQGIQIAHDLLDTMHFRKRDAKRRRPTGAHKIKKLQFN